MNLLEIALPGSILLLVFLLKLFVDRTVTVPDFIAALIELPVDVALLATSLVAAFTISDQSHVAAGFIYFVIYVVGTIIAVVLWRRSQSHFIADRYWSLFWRTTLGYGLCGYGLVHAVSLVSGASQ